MTTYTVIAPLINVKTQTRDGIQVIGLPEFAQLPPDVAKIDPGKIEHLLAMGLIKAEPEPEMGERPKAVPDKPKDSALKPDAKPATSTAQTTHTATQAASQRKGA
jgi:hypothetical protein